MKKLLDQFNTLPRWVQWMPFAILFLSALLIGAVIDLKEAQKGKALSEVNSSADAALPDAETAPNHPYGVNQADPDNYGAVLDLALHGNYQAQRNVAYGFVARPYHKQEKNPVLGCAWYLVVLNSGSRKIDTGDQGNVQVYCGKLEPDLLEAAKYNATKFMAEISENTKLGKMDD